ncbi:polyphosphate kinase 2 family protein [Granulicella mallensis]|uniref:PPK2 family polyphosphate:nucleotide phosphotransferase n=1 Tax=Granulicella mallensis TaxID=940614 RepID=A0A7W7ZQ41_9BACT|nr:polyphosphate kinase 2 family protein [Granulicella mallensis]MBB5063733.1 PPK2 family polyphosphate:nucleotide phosphotransferase [Granulicella mallensis]
MKLKSDYLVKPHTKVRLSHLSTSETGDFHDKDAAEPVLAKHREQLDALQDVLYASQSRAVLIVLQGMDTAGKDGTIRHIFSGINPQGCDVASFKVPTPLEARHEFLWRCQAQTPPRGMISIFNRSHYEDVLSPRVHGLIGEKTARRRMDNINGWEQTLVDNEVVILKFFLHISREEQTSRLQARIDTPGKRWKLSPADFAERKFWPKYVDAYEDILQHTSPKHAPWFVIPADNKWYRNVAISQILVDAMKGLKLEYPKPTFDPSGIKLTEESADSTAKKVEARKNRKSKDAPAVDATKAT